MMEILRLAQREPIACGNLRLVFEHPRDPELLVKVMRPDALERRYAKPSAWYKTRRRFGGYVLFMREIREFLAVKAADENSCFSQEIRGLVATDLGLGLVTPAIRNRTGGLAPTLADLVDRNSLDATARAALVEFLARLLDSPLVVSDLHERNLVYDERPGAERFVMIDGIGASTWIPWKTWFPALNRRSKQARVARLHRRLAAREERRELGEEG